ncbi:MAG: TRM11 family methyltransferase [Desulfurococcaceae archaeon TW002]
MLYYVYLSGEHRELPFLELRAVMDAEKVKYRFIAQLDQVAIIKSAEPLEALLSRAVLSKYAGVLLGVSEVTEGVQGIKKILRDSDVCLYGGYDYVNFRRVKQYGTQISYEDVLSTVNELSGSLCRGGTRRLDIIVTEGCVVIGLRTYERDLKSYRAREPSERPFYAPGTMTPYMARVFVNLSRASVRERHVILDSFCGAGGFLLEACFMGLRYVGVEINPVLSEGAVKNLIHYGCVPEVVSGDSCYIPLDRVDAIATDPPYGRMSRPAGTELINLMKCFLSESYRVLRSEGYLVFAQRIDIPLEEMITDAGFTIVERVPNWVHGSLTRDIFVVRKK